MTRVRTNLSAMTEDEKKEHRRRKNAEKSRNWRAKNPEKHRQQVKEWEALNPDKVTQYRRTASLNYNENHREKRRAQWRDWNVKHKDYRKEWRRQRDYEQMYGITVGGYDALVVAQGGVCGVCGTNKPGGAGRWHIDHNHDTGAVRGLLCSKCNTGGGLFNDDPELLRKAVEWFSKP